MRPNKVFHREPKLTEWSATQGVFPRSSTKASWASWGHCHVHDAATALVQPLSLASLLAASLSPCHEPPIPEFESSERSGVIFPKNATLPCHERNILKLDYIIIKDISLSLSLSLPLSLSLSLFMASWPFGHLVPVLYMLARCHSNRVCQCQPSIYMSLSQKNGSLKFQWAIQCHEIVGFQIVTFVVDPPFLGHRLIQAPSWIPFPAGAVRPLLSLLPLQTLKRDLPSARNCSWHAAMLVRSYWN